LLNASMRVDGTVVTFYPERAAIPAPRREDWAKPHMEMGR
jgi:hypothetical protein